MPKLLDLTGQRFGRWTALYLSMRRNGAVYWWCRCDCGTETNVQSSGLRSGASTSCGCFQRQRATELTTKRNLIHGQSESLEYSSWVHMLSCCNDPSNKHYRNYGGRGIQVCQRWLQFENFAADMGARPIGLTLDRYPDPDGNYEPGNCRWATRSEQQRNRRANVLVCVDDKMITVTEALGSVRAYKLYNYYQRKYRLSAQDAYERTMKSYNDSNNRRVLRTN